MKICGTGIVFSGGRGLGALETALTSGAVPPLQITVPFQAAPFPVYAIPAETLKDRAVLGEMRRADRFSKMATLAAYDAMAESGAPLENPERIGIIFSTAFGPHNTTFSFLDDILNYGDAGVSPTLFSNSVHNAAVSYISNTLKIKGPTWTITRFRDPFQQALLLAQVWLEEGRCDQVLVGAGDECGTVLDYICSQKLTIAETAAQMRPFFDAAGPAVIPGELAVFFLLSRDTAGGVQIALRPKDAPPPDLLMVDFESPQPDPRSAQIPTGCWSHLAGATPISTAFSCAAAGLMLQRQKVYRAGNLLSGHGGINTDFKSVRLQRIECSGEIDLNIRMSQ
jgi:3-oxoacyl-[acyl-carrier-protein] synthase II